MKLRFASILLTLFSLSAVVGLAQVPDSDPIGIEVGPSDPSGDDPIGMEFIPFRADEKFGGPTIDMFSPFYALHGQIREFALAAPKHFKHLKGFPQNARSDSVLTLSRNWRFSGKTMLGTKRVSFRGKLDSNGTSVVKVGKATITVQLGAAGILMGELSTYRAAVSIHASWPGGGTTLSKSVCLD